MKKWLKYENFWTRNIGTFLFFYGIIIVQEYFNRNDRNISHYSLVELFFLFFPLYGLILIYNILIIKKLLFKKMYLKYILFSIVFLFLMSIYFYLYSYCLEDHASYYNDLSVAFFALIMGATPFFMHTWISENAIKTKKDLINKNAELTFLKQQISPHFLFNALNNLYGTSLAAPEIVSEKILQLSDLLRYQIESTKIDYVDFNEEILFINKYLDYIRYKTSNLKITNTINGSVENFLIPPLLFLPLIENAVKYSSETENPTIEIDWNINPESIIFVIKNTFQNQNSRINGTKTGLDNLYKRLEILNIKHELVSNTKFSNLYNVSLQVWKTN